MQLIFYNDTPASATAFQSIDKENLLDALKALDRRANRKGLDKLDPSRMRGLSIGLEVDAGNTVQKNGYGVFNLSWQASLHPEWAGQIATELEQIRGDIKRAHQTPLRFLIWVGMGGSAEDKNAYNAAGLLKGGVRCYVLDSTDPAKLKAILADMARRSKLGLAAILKRTLVAGMAMGMTSYEPVVNLEMLAALFDQCEIDSRPNFLYMTLPGSLLDRFASARGYRKVELQLDNRNTTAGRHSAPLTRGSLYPLGLCGVDLRAWIEATALTAEEIRTAWKLAAFLHAHGVSGRDKVTLLPGGACAAAALWTKQDFEESLGKSDALGIKIVIGEKIKLLDYRAPKEVGQDRVFLAVQTKGQPGVDLTKLALLRRAGYPLVVLTMPRGALLARYMQFMHYVVFGVAWLRGMNFVTQPSVELYKAITERLWTEARVSGGIAKTNEWAQFHAGETQAKWRGRITLRYNGAKREGAAPDIYAALLKDAVTAGQATYGELTFFGDTRYSADGKAMHRQLVKATGALFHARLKMPADVYEGPAMNHSYHEMIIGHGRCFSTIVIGEKGESMSSIGYTAGYHWAQYLATLRALRERGRAVVSIVVQDLEPRTLASLDEFFRQAALRLH